MNQIPWLTKLVIGEADSCNAINHLIKSDFLILLNHHKLSSSNNSWSYNSYRFNTRYNFRRLRIEQIGENEGKVMQAGAAIAVVGW